MVTEPTHVEEPYRSIQAAEPKGAEKQHFEAFVFISRWRLAQVRHQVTGRLRVERGDDIEVAGVIGCDLAEVELSLGLLEPHLGLRGPEDWQLKCDCILLGLVGGNSGLSLFWTIGVTNEAGHVLSSK